MCASWALVSRTFAVTGLPLFSSGDDEQPPTRVSASAVNAAANVSRLSVIRGAHELRPMPPAAAKRLEEGGSVGEAVGFRLHEAETGLLIRLIGVQNREIGRVAVLVLETGQIQARFGRIRCSRG